MEPERMPEAPRAPKAVAPPAELVDPQGRTLDYLRLAVTDRCNLRCRYCMPEEGLRWAPPLSAMTLDEMFRIGALFTRLGVRKIRITGGEPLMRRGVVDLMARLAALPAKPEMLLTTNGTILADHLAELAAAGVRRINLSLDSLDPDRWTLITRRKGFAKVRGAVDAVLAAGLGLKINMVVLPGVNDREIPDFVELTRRLPVTVRFIEPMPFTGAGQPLEETITGQEILLRLRGRYDLQPLSQEASAVAREFTVRGFVGKIGIVEGHSRKFCATCSRLRIDVRGRFRTCLYGASGTNLTEMMRNGATDRELEKAVRGDIAFRFRDGKTAELAHHLVGLESMSSIGG